MKQIVQNNRSGALTLAEVPSPALLAGGVLVETCYSAVSVGTEGMKVRTARRSLLGKARARPDLVRQVLGTYRSEGLASTYRKVMNRLDAPAPLGYSLAGRVVAVSPEVDDLRVGQVVACAGAGFANHAEYVFVPRNLCTPVPDGVPLDAAAFATIGAIALHGVRQGTVQVGESVAVVGLGLVGLLAVQILAASGTRVFGVDLDPERVELASESGAIDGAGPHSAGFDQRAAAFTFGRGFDTVVVSAADPTSEAVALAARMARDRGRVVVLGIVGMALEHKLFYDKELELRMSRSYGPGRYDASYEEEGLDYPFSYVRWTEQRNLDAFLGMLALGQVSLDRLISHRFPFADAPRAYEMLAGPDSRRMLGVVFDYGGAAKARSPRVDLALPAAAVPGQPRAGLGVALVGAGNFAKTTLLPLFKQEPGVRLTGVVTSTSASARHTAARFGFGFAATAPEAAIADAQTDLVVIATRHDLHAQLTSAALDAGKAVMVEKPLALDETELRDVVQALARARQPFLHVGFNRRFAPMVVRARAFLPARGPYTMIYRVNAGFVPREHWYHGRQGGGRIVGEACHFIDLFSAVAGAAPARVSASAMADAGTYHGDNVSITVEYADGSIGTLIYLACGDRSVPKERFEISAAGSTAIIEDYRVLRLARGGQQTIVRSRLRQDKGHAAQVTAVVQALVRGTAPPVPAQESVLSTLATLAAVRALQARHPIDIDPRSLSVADAAG